MLEGKAMKNLNLVILINSNDHVGKKRNPLASVWIEVLKTSQSTIFGFSVWNRRHSAYCFSPSDFSLFKNSDAGKDWGQGEKGMVAYMTGWHHRHNGRESLQPAGVGDGPGGLACCIAWGSKKSNPTQWLNWTDLCILESNYKQRWVPKNWGFETVLLKVSFESLLDSQEINPVNPKESNPKYSLEGLMLKLQYVGYLM